MHVVVILILNEDPSGVSLIHDQNVVEDHSADGADHSLATGVHARSLGRAEQHVHLLAFEDSVEGGGALAVAVPAYEQPDLVGRCSTLRDVS